MQDRRGVGTGAIGGGLGVVGLVIALLLGVNPFEGGDSSPVSTGGEPSRDIEAECRTGEDANREDDCRIVGVVNSVQAYWTDTIEYEPAPTRFFSNGVNTACGQASSAVGPFFCPADDTVYLDLTFFDDLRSKFGAQGGPFAEAYVVAHEYGHHVQHIQGTMGQVGQGAGAESDAVRLELQADCFAGSWAQGAESTGFIEEISDADIADALNAAAAIGDDRLQQEFQGDIDPDSWTHGSSEQRQRWFTAGYRSGPTACDTFAASDL